MLGSLLMVQMWFCMAGARDSAPYQKWAQHRGVLMHFAWQAQYKRIQETCSSDMIGGQGRDFLRGVAFWSMRSSGFVRWFCVTGAALCMTQLHFFVAGAVLLTNGVERSQSALVHSTFHFWRMSRRIASFLMLSTSKVEGLSQNCFVFDVVKFKKWGSLTEMLRFFFKSCQVQKTEEVSQNSFVFKLADRHIDRQLQLPLQSLYATLRYTNSTTLKQKNI